MTHTFLVVAGSQGKCCLCGPRFTFLLLGSDSTCCKPAAQHHSGAQPSDGAHRHKTTGEVRKEIFPGDLDSPNISNVMYGHNHTFINIPLHHR